MTSIATKNIDTIPTVTCPGCGKPMRLATLEPDGDTDRLSFDCECGFEYGMSDRALADLSAGVVPPPQSDDLDR